MVAQAAIAIFGLRNRWHRETWADYYARVILPVKTEWQRRR